MMINSRSEKAVEAKQEGDDHIDYTKDGMYSRALISSTSSRHWAGGPVFRNPRIVRVSRSFGGKDRHSKVCTVRGLRDRRIRLSVPTAIQLYELQDKLRLSQPSKVIDWLLEATKHDIDNLPPLHFPQGFDQFLFQQTLSMPNSHHHEPNNTALTSNTLSLSPFFDANCPFLKEEEGGRGEKEYHQGICVDQGDHKGKGIKINHEQEDQQQGNYIDIGAYIASQGNFDAHHPMLSSNGSTCNYNSSSSYHSFHELPSSNLSLSHFGDHGLLPSQIDPHANNGNGVQLTTGSHSHQLFLCPPSANPSVLFGSSTPYPPYL